jgi:hypothetical protein
MPEMKAEAPEVVPQSKTVDSKIENPQNQNRAIGEDSISKPATGRLQARATRV